MIVGLIQAKTLIVEEAQELQDRQLIADISDEEKWSAISELVEVFSPLTECIAIAERKCGSLGEAVKSLLELGKSLLKADWSNPVINALLTSYLHYFSQQKLKDEFGLLLTAYLFDRRYKMDYITRHGAELVLTTVIQIATKCGLDIAKIRRPFLLEFESYCKFEDDFAAEQRPDETAAQWWSKHADSGRFQ